MRARAEGRGRGGGCLRSVVENQLTGTFCRSDGSISSIVCPEWPLILHRRGFIIIVDGQTRPPRSLLRPTRHLFPSNPFDTPLQMIMYFIRNTRIYIYTLTHVHIYTSDIHRYIRTYSQTCRHIDIHTRTYIRTRTRTHILRMSRVIVSVASIF